MMGGRRELARCDAGGELLMTAQRGEAEGLQDGRLLLRGLGDRVVAVEQLVRLVDVDAVRSQHLNSPDDARPSGSFDEVRIGDRA